MCVCVICVHTHIYTMYVYIYTIYLLVYLSRKYLAPRYIFGETLVKQPCLPFCWGKEVVSLFPWSSQLRPHHFCSSSLKQAWTSPSHPFSADLPLASGKQYWWEWDPGDPGVQLQQSLHQQVRAWFVLPSHRSPRSSPVGRGSSCLSWSHIPIWFGDWMVRKTLVIDVSWEGRGSWDATCTAQRVRLLTTSK